LLVLQKIYLKAPIIASGKARKSTRMKGKARKLSRKMM
jgi:hypothetical protein